MNKSIFSLLLFFCSLFTESLFAQKSINLEGIIGMEGGELFSYDLKAQATGPNEFKGTVKTYAYKNKEVTAEVILTVLPEENKVELRETKILDNLGFKSNVTICLVRAVLTYDPGKGVLKGPIITQTSGDGAYCAIGNITFMNGPGIAPLFQEQNKTEEPEIPEEIVVNIEEPKEIPQRKEPKQTVSPQQPQTPQQPETPVVKKDNQPKVITDGVSQTYKWNSDILIMDIWDDNTVDGDKVTIIHNGKEILREYTLQESPKRITINVGDNELNIIQVKALNYGSEPPNTAMMILYDEEKEYPVKAHNEPGHFAEIRVLKEFD